MSDNKTTSNDHYDDMELVYASLHFYYNDSDSMSRFQQCMDAPRVLRAVEDFERKIHEILKYAKDPDVWGEINGYAGLDRARDMLFECFADNNVRVPGWE